MTQVVRTTTISTFIDQFRPAFVRNIVDGGSRRLVMQRDLASPPSPQQGDNTLVNFVNPVPLGTFVQSAKLRITIGKVNEGGTGPANTSGVFVAHRATNPWNINTVSWGNAPNIDTLTSVSIPANNYTQGQVVEFDVTQHLQMVADGQPFYGWRFKTTSVTPFDLVADGTSGITLTIDYSTTPGKPVNPTPGSSSELVYVGSASPDLTVATNLTSRWHTLAAMQVSVSTTSFTNSDGTFATPSWTSTEYATSTGKFPLSLASGYTPPTSGNGYWWIARIKTDTGIWSEWSQPVRWIYQPKGVVTLINPPPGTGSEIDDVSPLISWSFTGTQKAYSVLLATAGSGPLRILWESGVVNSATQSAPIPENIIQPGTEYGVVIKVWDQYDRQTVSVNSVTVTAHSTASQTFTVVPDPSVAGVTNLRAEQPENKPYLRLLFDRATSPDSFQLIKNTGSADAGDFTFNFLPQFVGGNTYEVNIYPAEPGVTDTWTIRAVVNNKMSEINPSITVRRESRVAWLSDFTTDTYIPITGQSPVSVQYTETGETIDVFNSQYKVRITTGIQARSGSVNGSILGSFLKDGTTSEDLRQRLLDYRRDPSSRAFFLSVSGAACRVYIYNVTIGPVYGAPYGRMFNIAFDWHEVPG